MIVYKLVSSVLCLYILVSLFSVPEKTVHPQAGANVVAEEYPFGVDGECGKSKRKGVVDLEDQSPRKIPKRESVGTSWPRSLMTNASKLLGHYSSDEVGSTRVLSSPLRVKQESPAPDLFNLSNRDTSSKHQSRLQLELQLMNLKKVGFDVIVLFLRSRFDASKQARKLLCAKRRNEVSRLTSRSATNDDLSQFSKTRLQDDFRQGIRDVDGNCCSLDLELAYVVNLSGACLFQTIRRSKTIQITMIQT